MLKNFSKPIVSQRKSVTKMMNMANGNPYAVTTQQDTYT